MEIFSVLFSLPFFALMLLLPAFWVWMLVDCLTHETPKDNEKLLWVLLIIFTKFIGAAVYYFVRRPKRLVELGH